MQRAFAAVVITAAVVLAGCSGVFGGGDSGGSTPTITPMTVPTDEPTPTPAPQLAPGLTRRGLESATALVAAHTSVLENRSFVTTATTTGLASNGSAVFRRTRTLRAGPNGGSVYSVIERKGSYGQSRTGTFPVRTEAWLDEGRVVLNRTYANGTTSYDRLRVGSGGRLGIAGSALRYTLEPFGTANTVVTERERNGTTLYLVRGTARDDGGGNVSLRLLVDSRGVVREYRLVRRPPFETSLSRTVATTRFSRIGTIDAPERPSWVETALNRTAPTPEPTTTPSVATTATNRTATGVHSGTTEPAW